MLHIKARKTSFNNVVDELERVVAIKVKIACVQLLLFLPF